MRLHWIAYVWTILSAAASAQSFLITSVINAGVLADTQMSPGSAVFIAGSLPAGAGRDYSFSVGGVTSTALIVMIDVKAKTVRIEATLPPTAPVGATTITLFYQGAASNAFPITLSAFAPEFLEQPSHLSGPPVSPSAPAAPGEFLRLFVNGLPSLPQAPVLTIAGENVTLQSNVIPAGSGIAELDFFVPSDVSTGLVPFVVTMGSYTTKPMTVAVGTGPVISAVVSTASYGSSSVVTAGSMVSLFGVGFGTVDSSGTFPSTTVNGYSVMFGTTAAPIYSLTASQGQINVLVPSQFGTGGIINVTVQGPSSVSQPFPVMLAPSTPGVFFYSDPSNLTRRNAVALQANTAWLAMPLSMATAMGLPSGCSKLSVSTLCGQPIHAGSYLQIYLTGLGATSPNLPTGSVAPVSGNPLYQTVTTPMVTVGGQPATVLFSGLAPGYGGFYQLDVQLAANTPVGNDIVLQIAMPGGGTDAGTTIAVVP